MKLLLDENLPPALMSALEDMFPGSTHVLMLGFGQTPDIEVYRYAGEHGFTLLTKDSDYDALWPLRRTAQSHPAEGRQHAG